MRKVINLMDMYLKSGLYKQLSAFGSYASVCEKIAPDHGPHIIGIDGPASGGKTSLAKALEKFYLDRNIPVSYFPLDHFLTNRDFRNSLYDPISKGHLTLHDYTFKGWDHEKYYEFLESAKKILGRKSSTSKTFVIENAYNRQTGVQDHLEKITIYPGGILIAEGTGIHVVHDKILDLKIRVDVRTIDTLFNRVLNREHLKDREKRLNNEFVLDRYTIIDLPHREVLAKETAGMADFVIDTTDSNNMLVYKNNN
jgi:uridine kinase